MTTLLRGIGLRLLRHRAEGIARRLRPHLPAADPLLDVGSGTGHLQQALRPRRVHGVDVSSLTMTGEPSVLFDGHRLPLATDSCGAVSLVHVLHYVDEPVSLLSETARVSRGPVLVLQSCFATGFGRAWLVLRERVTGWLFFHVARLVGLLPMRARYSLTTRTFLSRRHVLALAGQAGLAPARLEVSAGDRVGLSRDLFVFEPASGSASVSPS
ncbi:MAG: methyltransferase domain-containing protein [Acidobacteriota bacterium]